MPVRAKEKSNLFTIDPSEDPAQQKLRGINIDMEALRNAVRTVDNSHTQTLSLVSKLNEELSALEPRIKRLELQLEEVMRYFKSGGRYTG